MPFPLQPAGPGALLVLLRRRLRLRPEHRLERVQRGRLHALVLALRELCGAHDPEIASHLHTSSLRALYGVSKVKNAVHCSDLPEDAPLEVDYFFSILC